MFRFTRNPICTKAAPYVMQFSRKHFWVIDFLYKLCHNIVTENVPDNVPEYITESEVLRQNAESDHQGHCPDQRLLGEHHFSCHQRPARCPARDQGACTQGNAGGRVRAQHQCTTAEDPAVPQSGVRGQGYPQSLLLRLLSPAAAGRYPVRLQWHRNRLPDR